MTILTIIERAERQWQRDRLHQYLEGTATPLPLPRKSRRKAA